MLFSIKSEILHRSGVFNASSEINCGGIPEGLLWRTGEIQEKDKQVYFFTFFFAEWAASASDFFSSLRGLCGSV
jgi:hypothetical protein